MSLNGHIDMQVNKLALFRKPWFNVMFNEFNDAEHFFIFSKWYMYNGMFKTSSKSNK